MNKFNIGDKVRIRKDSKDNKMCGGLHWWENMRQLKGMEDIVVGMTDRGNYMLKGTNFLWSEEMLELAQEESKEIYTFQEVVSIIKTGETYENTNYTSKIKSISMDKNGMIRIKYIENNMNNERTTLLNDTVFISKNSTFKKEFKKSSMLYIIEHKKNGKQYKFRSDDNLAIGDFVICDTNFGKTYGKVVEIKLIEASCTDFKKLQAFKEYYNQNYKKCWKA